MMGTLRTGRKAKRLMYSSASFLNNFRMKKTRELTTAEADMFPLWSSPRTVILLTPIHVTPITNYPPRTVSGAPQVAWDVSDLRRASLQTRPPPHNNSPRVTSSAQLLSHRRTWPLSARTAPLGPLSFLLLAIWAATSVFRLLFTKLVQEPVLRLPGVSLLGVKGISASVIHKIRHVRREWVLQGSLNGVVIWCSRTLGTPSPFTASSVDKVLKKNIIKAAFIPTCFVKKKSTIMSNTGNRFRIFW